MTDYDVMTDKGIQDTNIQVALLGHNNNASIPNFAISNPMMRFQTRQIINFYRVLILF
jgi:hypothetical protein